MTYNVEQQKGDCVINHLSSFFTFPSSCYGRNVATRDSLALGIPFYFPNMLNKYNGLHTNLTVNSLSNKLSKFIYFIKFII